MRRKLILLFCIFSADNSIGILFHGSSASKGVVEVVCHADFDLEFSRVATIDSS